MRYYLSSCDFWIIPVCKLFTQNDKRCNIVCIYSTAVGKMPQDSNIGSNSLFTNWKSIEIVIQTNFEYWKRWMRSNLLKFWNNNLLQESGNFIAFKLLKIPTHFICVYKSKSIERNKSKHWKVKCKIQF